MVAAGPLDVLLLRSLVLAGGVMTVVSVSRWTCNMCGCAEETEQDERPEGWLSYGMAGEVRALGHLCERCSTTVLDERQS